MAIVAGKVLDGQFEGLAVPAGFDVDQKLSRINPASTATSGAVPPEGLIETPPAADTSKLSGFARSFQ